MFVFTTTFSTIAKYESNTNVNQMNRQDSIYAQ